MTSNDQKLLDFIKTQMESGYGRKETFNNAAFELELSGSGFNSKTSDGWFSFYDNGQVNEIPEDWRHILQVICQEYEKARTGPESSQCPQFDMCLNYILSARYSLDYKLDINDTIQFYLFDNFFGRKKQLKLNDSLPPTSSNLKLVVLSDNYIVYIPQSEDFEEDSTFDLCLLHINIQEASIRLKNKLTVNGTIEHIQTDIETGQRFVIFIHGINERHLQVIELVGDRLELGGTFPNVDGEIGGLFAKFRGNKICAVEVDQDNEDQQPTFPFVEWTLNATNIQKRTICNIKMMDQFDINDFFFSQVHSWFGDTCYSLLRYNAGMTYVYRFDLETREVLEFKTTGN
ncbi:hypothetical protein M3Y97_00943900 [Aphelenchoides bicaudatus]|nr:hypothetical protein M3Y97_00943900 [Aphelenchoides bicaudatus]